MVLVQWGAPGPCLSENVQRDRVTCPCMVRTVAAGYCTPVRDALCVLIHSVWVAVTGGAESTPGLWERMAECHVSRSGWAPVGSPEDEGINQSINAPGIV